jgi:glycosyltransferase involved in cell wall biosynthesis
VAAPPVFHVVTPTLNMARYVDETIESVVGQAGDFAIRYHIQDGGSSDGTLEIARAWQRRVEAREVPLACRAVHVTVESGPDRGMYDAVAAGFRRLAPASGDLMTWINADDRLEPGAMSAVAAAVHDRPELELLGGRTALFDDVGRIDEVGPLVAYSRACLAAGLHDGRRLPFVQQPGTFWRARLWKRTGGVDARFKLAGDFDLWRRFAAKVEYVTLDVVTGRHRVREDQLSADLGAYYLEVDASIARWMPRTARTFRDYCNRHRENRPFDGGRFSARIARRDAATGRWELVDWPPLPPWRNMLHPIDGDWATVRGFDPPEGPFPDLGLETQFRWIVGCPATLLLFSSRGGVRTVSLTMSSMGRPQTLEVSIDGAPPHRLELRGATPGIEMLSLAHEFTPGPCQVEISVESWMETAEGRRLGVIFDSIGFEPDPPWHQRWPWLLATGKWQRAATDARHRDRPRPASQVPPT